jgi:hypothetical protein
VDAEEMKTDLYAKRIASTMKARKAWVDIVGDCMRLNLTSLALSAQKQVTKYDNKLVKMLKPKLQGDTLKEISEQDIESARCSDITALFPDHKAYMVICPFHSDRRPSASIKKGYLVCFSCGEKADVIKCYQKLNNATFIEAVKELR